MLVLYQDLHQVKTTKTLTKLYRYTCAQGTTRLSQGSRPQLQHLHPWAREQAGMAYVPTSATKKNSTRGSL